MIWMVVFLNQVVRLGKPLDFDKDSWARIKKKKKKKLLPKIFRLQALDIHGHKHI